MMERISENVTAVVLSEIRPKVFLGAHLVITGTISYGFAVMHPPTQSCDFAGTLSYCLSPAPQAVPQAAGFSAGLSPVPQAAAGAASAFLFQPKRLERDILIDLHLFRQTAFPVCNAIVTFCFSEKSTHKWMTESLFVTRPFAGKAIIGTDNRRTFSVTD